MLICFWSLFPSFVSRRYIGFEMWVDVYVETQEFRGGFS